MLAAIVGAAGLRPTLAAARAGKRILLANKEALVIGGALFMAAVAAGGATLLPIDSEHNAIFQCLPRALRRATRRAAGVRRILLTASGGPFRDAPLARARARSRPTRRARIPNWSMGRKISVDSATMMNKGLEVIEAHWLFGVAPRASIEVVIHPQSVIHSLVEYVDGSVLAQLGQPGHAHADRAGARAFRTASTAGVAPLDLARARGASRSRRPITSAFPASPSPSPRWRPAAARRRCSTPPTKSRSQPSSRGRIALHRHRRRLRRDARACRRRPGGHAGRRARRRRRRPAAWREDSDRMPARRCTRT